jgi:hypothetical protein
LLIDDTGIGISPDDQALILEEFRQVGFSTDERSGVTELRDKEVSMSKFLMISRKRAWDWL